MIYVTGGAGFIGSAVIWELNKNGITDIVVVDHLGESDKWKNLTPLKVEDYIDKFRFLEMLKNEKFYKTGNDAIVHMGACSTTTEKDASYLFENNFNYTKQIMEWQFKNTSWKVIYASSAATYGNDQNGFIDDINALHSLKPLNKYAYSKHLVDINNYHNKRFSRLVGLKFFNVFGPNEYHKGDMASFIYNAYHQILRKEYRIQLFSSTTNQLTLSRDFIYIKDVVKVILFFLENPDIDGLFNVGTGLSHTWEDIVLELSDLLNITSVVRNIPIPPNIDKQYQYYTKADLNNLRLAGYDKQFMSLSDSMKDYVTNYLQKNDKRLTIN